MSFLFLIFFLFFFFVRQAPCLNLFDVSKYLQRLLISYLGYLRGSSASPELLLGGHCFELVHTSIIASLSNINCPLGPYVPAAMTCLLAVQAPCLTKLHHTTTSIPNRQHLYIQTTLHVTLHCALCHMGVTWASHRHYMGITQTLCRCYTNITQMLHQCYMDVYTRVTRTDTSGHMNP